jgi:hypothetical protein
MIWLGIFLLLGFDLTPDNILTHVVFLGEVEKLADLGRTLRAKPLGKDSIGEIRELIVTLLDDDKRENRNIWSDDAATNGFATPLAFAPLTVARVAIGKEEADTVGDENALFHRKPLLIIAAGDAEDISLELVTNSLSWNFLR